MKLPNLSATPPKSGNIPPRAPIPPVIAPNISPDAAAPIARTAPINGAAGGNTIGTTAPRS
ncbi:MAG: hypothetical protein CM15mV10_2200 [uncultured marine virus]|nr:MAG: hypothetical protein CM15mV10_2200 [uncultured marine virus]